MSSPPSTAAIPAGAALAPEAAAAGTTSSTEKEQKQQFGRILLDISNSVLPRDKLAETPSSKDGLPTESELQIRSLACDLLQIAGKLLKIPQVAMATACVLFHRFFYAKSMVRIKFDEVAMAALGLACKIEECPRRTRDIINVFKHIKQVRSGKPIQPMILDGAYIALKNQVIKAERRILKELGFCVHVKHPHKVIVMYLKWLKEEDNTALLQMSWNFMNDSLRTDVFVRYPPETIAVACIYLSARKLKVALPKNPSWFQVLSVEEDDIKECCYSMICLYNRKKPNQEELEGEVESLRRKQEQSRRAARGEPASGNTASNTPNASTPPSRSGSPTGKAEKGEKGRDGSNGHHHHRHGEREKIEYENGTNRSIMDSNFVRRKADGGDADDGGGGRGSKSRKHRDRDFRDRSRSRSRSPRRGHHESSSRDRSSGKKSREGRSSKRSPRSPEKHSAAAHSPSSKKSKKHRHRSRERYSAGDYYNQDSKNGGYHDSGSRSRKVRDERDRDYRR